MAFIQRVCLRNYKSIAACDVALGPLTFLVGPNGAGKSNFLDALRFVADSLRFSLDHALRDRGGIHEVRRRSGGHPNHFGLRLDFELPSGPMGHYAFQIAARPPGGFEVQTEECEIRSPGALASRSGFRVDRGVVRGLESSPAAAFDRLYLVDVSGWPEFRPLYEALARMGFHHPNPEKIRDPQAADAGEWLSRDAGNLASVWRRMGARDADRKQRVEQYLSKIVPGVLGVDVRAVGPKETLEFRQEMGDAEHSWRFLAANMSDGTLRALAVLVSLFQSAHGAPLMGIEEPALALHPAAACAMLDALQDAASSAQVVATTHNPSLLGDSKLAADSILAVEAAGGVTEIAGLDEPARAALADRPYTAGGLLGLNQLRPEAGRVNRRDVGQLQLFDQEES
jgi:predicted ATPase